jgi:5-methylcytosine-specific restriction endonuclease McrA
LRRRHLQQFPLCQSCLEQGRLEPARQVDHRIPFHGLADPRRLDPVNLMSLCTVCHMSKTNRDRQT